MYAPLPEPIIWLAVEFYDQRGGGRKGTFKADKQGLGLTKRNKKKFTAQQMLVLLADLAHNLIIWVKRELAANHPCFDRYGVMRMVRDVFAIAGLVEVSPNGELIGITLNKGDPFANAFQIAITPLLHGIVVSLGEI